jgi:hypothetical protein
LPSLAAKHFAEKIDSDIRIGVSLCFVSGYRFSDTTSRFNSDAPLGAET